MNQILEFLLVLSLTLSNPVYVLRIETAKEAGLEEQLPLALAETNPVKASTDAIATDWAITRFPASTAGMEEQMRVPTHVRLSHPVWLKAREGSKLFRQLLDQGQPPILVYIGPAGEGDPTSISGLFEFQIKKQEPRVLIRRLGGTIWSPIKWGRDDFFYVDIGGNIAFYRVFGLPEAGRQKILKIRNAAKRTTTHRLLSEPSSAGTEEKTQGNSILISPLALKGVGGMPGMLQLLIKAAPYLSQAERRRVTIYTENSSLVRLLRDELDYRVFTRFSDVQVFRPDGGLTFYTTEAEWLLRGQIPQVSQTVTLTAQNFLQEFATLLAVLDLPLTPEQIRVLPGTLQQAA